MRSSQNRLRVLVATPLGESGQGGIDRLNDLVFQVINARADSKLEVQRLVTRGQGGLLFAQFVFAFSLIRFFFKAISGKVDLLHIHLSISGSSYRKTVLGAVARLLGIPYVLHLHGCGFDLFWDNTNPYLARALDHLFLSCKRCIVLGSFWAQTIVNRLPSMADKLTILPNATPANGHTRLSPAEGHVQITFLGQLGQRKGTPQLIQALGLMADHPGWIATLAGDGAVKQSRVEIEKMKLSSRVEIPGWLESPEIAALLNHTDILVLPSFSENLPMVIIEAFASGIAVISTPVGAIPEVIQHERNGILVPVGDVIILARELKRLISDPQLRQRLGSAARRDHAQYYEIEPYVTKLLMLWRQVCEETS